jgi:hypothetical protein
MASSPALSICMFFVIFCALEFVGAVVTFARGDEHVAKRMETVGQLLLIVVAAMIEMSTSNRNRFALLLGCHVS